MASSGWSRLRPRFSAARRAARRKRLAPVPPRVQGQPQGRKVAAGEPQMMVDRRDGPPLMPSTLRHGTSSTWWETNLRQRSAVVAPFKTRSNSLFSRSESLTPRRPTRDIVHWLAEGGPLDLWHADCGAPFRLRRSETRLIG